MSKKVYEGLSQAVKEAIEYAKGNVSGSRVTYPVLSDIDVARLRKELGLSQNEFAVGFGISVRTLQDWEQGRRQPEGPARVLLNVIRKDPKSVTAAIWPESKRAGRRPR